MAFSVSIDAVETLTGLDFFPSLADPIEETVKALSKVSHWGLGEALYVGRGGVD